MSDLPYQPKGEPITEFIKFDNANFKTVTWKVPQDVTYKGKIVYVHGFSESAAIYTEFFDKLSQKGYEIFFFEQRGAGETSPGKEVGRTNEEHVFKDLEFMIKYNLDKREDKEEKLFLAGHLMGGGIVLNYGIKGKYIDQIRAIFVSGPLILLHANTEPNIILRKLAPIVSYLLPNMRFDSKLNYDYITSNEGWKAYIMKHDKVLVGTARQFQDMFVRGELLTHKDYVSKFNTSIPLLVLHGTDDNINWIKGTEKFFSLLNDNMDKEFVPVQGARHNLFLENEKIFGEVFDKLLSFLSSH